MRELIITNINTRLDCWLSSPSPGEEEQLEGWRGERCEAGAASDSGGHTQ